MIDFNRLSVSLVQLSVAEKYSQIISSHQQSLLGMFAYTETRDWTHLPLTWALHAQWTKVSSLPFPPPDARGMCPSMFGNPPSKLECFCMMTVFVFFAFLWQEILVLYPTDDYPL